MHCSGRSRSALAAADRLRGRCTRRPMCGPTTRRGGGTRRLSASRRPTCGRICVAATAQRSSHMPRLVLFGEYLCHHIGGAEKSTYLLAKELQRNPELEIVPVSGVCEEYERSRERIPYEGLVEVPIVRLKYRLPFLQYTINSGAVSDYFRRSDADVLFANAQAAPMAINRFDGPSVYFIHDEMSLNVYRTYDKSVWKRLKFAGRQIADFPFMLRYRRENERAMEKASLVVANSSYTARRARDRMGVRAEVIYPQIDVRSLSEIELPPRDERPYIMMVGDGAVKGADTFLRIAELMPDREFLAVGRSYGGRKRGNVTFRGFVPDPVTHYREAGLVLLPSTWEEGFGMVSVEAAALGVPAIVSDRGGLPETVPSRALVVENYREPTEWVDRIRRVLDDYEAHSRACSTHAEQFDGRRQAERLVDLVRETAGVDLWKEIR
ncbi:MAG: glycosyltransferase [Candidatus Eisenbacteria bacterium]|nr:glycosyltransferase [Candidatus Eisenbacteria bacterium]